MSQLNLNHKKNSSACERNKSVILEILARYFPKNCHILEIASGSGQHANYFTSKQSGWVWQPTDVDSEAIASISAYRKEVSCDNFLAPIKLSTIDKKWSVGLFDVIFCCNMIHISPWESSLGLFRHSNNHLKFNGLFVLYGPFFQTGVKTSLSNISFDQSLRQQDMSWGIRNLDKVTKAAEQYGLKLLKVHEMPANNLTIIFEKKSLL